MKMKITALRDEKKISNHCKQGQAATDQTMVSWSNVIFWCSDKQATIYK